MLLLFRLPVLFFTCIWLFGCSHQPYILSADTTYLLPSMQTLPPVEKRKANIAFDVAESMTDGLVSIPNEIRETGVASLKYPQREMLMSAGEAITARWFELDLKEPEPFHILARVDAFEKSIQRDTGFVYPVVSMTIEIKVLGINGEVILSKPYSEKVSGKRIFFSTVQNSMESLNFAFYKAMVIVLDKAMVDVADVVARTHTAGHPPNLP